MASKPSIQRDKRFSAEEVAKRQYHTNYKEFENLVFNP
jgi:hypothetical protein